MCILLWKYFSRQIYSYNFHICKLTNLKVIDDLYSQCLTQNMSKTTFFTNTEGVEVIGHPDFTNNKMEYSTLVVCTKPARIFYFKSAKLLYTAIAITLCPLHNTTLKWFTRLGMQERKFSIQILPESFCRAKYASYHSAQGAICFHYLLPQNRSWIMSNSRILTELTLPKLSTKLILVPIS